MTSTLPRIALPESQISNAESVVSNPALVDDPADIQATSTAWQDCTVIGLDTEFVRERTFRARPGLVQVSDGNSVWLLDAVACPEVPELGSMLADSRITNVLHSVGEDLEVLHAVGGAWPQSLFDTQVAAAMLGMPLQCRYEHLVAAVFGIELDGGKARNDWCRRPLAPALLRYAAEDVVWLPALKARLEELLQQAGRLDWLIEDCDRILRQAQAPDRLPPLARVKGAGRLADAALARLNALAEWRETVADQRDLPRRFVMTDESLIVLAEADADGRLGAALDTLHEGQRRRYGPELKALLPGVDSQGFSRPDWINPLSPEQRNQVRELQSIVKSTAESLGIDPAVIASKKELTRLVRGERPDWLNGWRFRVLGQQLEAASVSISAPAD